MKLLISTIVWFAAIVIAALVLYRLVRRKPMLLHGRMGRRAIRLAAIVIVGMGMHRPETVAQPETTSHFITERGDTDRVSETPETLLALARNVRIRLLQENGQRWDRLRLLDNPTYSEPWSQSPNLLRVVNYTRSNSGQAGDSEAINVHIIATAADELQHNPLLLDEQLNTLLWHHLQQLPAPSDETETVMLAIALDRIQENARMLNTLTRAQAQTKIQLRTNPQAWMSKAGPRPGYYQVSQEDVDTFVDTVTLLYPTTEAGLWRREGITVLALDADAISVELIRQNQTTVMVPSKPYRISRLDLLRTGDEGGRVLNDWLGEIGLPPNRTLRSADLPALLDAAARQRIDLTIAQSLKNDDQALLELERNMSWCLPQVLAAIAAADTHEAAGLRLLVYLYDPYLIEPPWWNRLEQKIKTGDYNIERQQESSTALDP